MQRLLCFFVFSARKLLATRQQSVPAISHEYDTGISAHEVPAIEISTVEIRTFLASQDYCLLDLAEYPTGEYSQESLEI
jgi:hypothetical protein